MNIKLQIWDTAGQERYRSITKSFFKSANGIVLVFDITNEKSFQNLDKWILEIEENAPTYCKYIIIGNKSDLNEQRTVSLNEINNYIKEIKSYYFETSAKNNENLNEAFIYLSNEIIKDKKKEEIYQLSGEKNSIFEDGNKKNCCN